MIDEPTRNLNTHVPVGMGRRRAINRMPSRLQPSGRIFVVCGVWLVALGLYFLFLRPALLPEDPRFIGSSMETLRAAGAGLERWLNHVFDVMGGFMVATGAMTLLAALRLHARREWGTLITLIVAGAASVGLMSTTNFLIGSDFRWPLLLPALLWLAGVLCYWREGAGSNKPTGEK